MSNYRYLKFTRTEGRADLTIARPPKNLLDVPVLEEMLEALEPNRDDEKLKVMLIRGEGSHFCGGVETEALTADKVGMLMPLYTRLIDYLNDIRGITVALVKGEATGAGCEIASFCDITFAAKSAQFSFPEISWGIFPPIATAILPRLIGRNRALDWLFSGNIFSAAEAAEAQMVARVIPDDEIDNFVEKFVSRLASYSAPAVVLAKKAVDRALYTPVMEALKKTESTYMLDLMNSIDPHEGLKARLEGREPVWKNK